MRTLIVTILTSLDGYVADASGGFESMPVDESFSAYNVERLRAADTLLLGATTYREFLAYWPPVAADESQPPIEREISRLNGAIEKVVVSDSLGEPTGPWADTSRVVGRDDARDVVRDLRAGDGGDVLMFGSLTVWNDLLAHGLVDELHVMVGNASIGAGTRGFSVDSGRLDLLEARPLEGSPNVLLRYAAPTG